jgi:hypothetical protein
LQCCAVLWCISISFVINMPFEVPIPFKSTHVYSKIIFLTKCIFRNDISILILHSANITTSSPTEPPTGIDWFCRGIFFWLLVW